MSKGTGQDRATLCCLPWDCLWDPLGHGERCCSVPRPGLDKGNNMALFGVSVFVISLFSYDVSVTTTLSLRATEFDMEYSATSEPFDLKLPLFTTY